MSEKRHSIDEFITELTSLLKTQASKGKGSIYLTQKPFLPPSSTRPTESPDNLAEPSITPLLVRASNGVSKDGRKAKKKIRLSTVVQPEDLETFFARYADVCKVGMQGLKKRDRSKRKKVKGGKKKGDGAK